MASELIDQGAWLALDIPEVPTLPDGTGRYAELAPVAIIGITFLNDLARHFGGGTDLPKSMKKLTDLLSEFIKDEDCEEHDQKADLDIHSPIWKYRVLTIIPLFNALAHLWRIGSQMYFKTWHGQMDDAISTVSWLYASLRIWMKPPQTVPYLLLIYCLAKVALTAAAFLFASNWQDLQIMGWMVAISEAVGSALLTYVSGTFPVDKRLPSANVASANEIPSSSKSVPEDGTSLWQYSTYSFVKPIIDAAPKKKLEESDVWSLSPFLKHKNGFKKHREYFERNPNRSLVRFLLRSNAKDIALGVLSEIYSSTGVFLLFWLTMQLLTTLERENGAINHAYGYAICIFVLNLSFSQVGIFQLWHSQRSYVRARGQIMCAIHHKALKRREHHDTSPVVKGEDTDALEHSDLGAVVSLLREDASTIAQRFREVYILPALLVRLIGSTIFLYQLLGWSAMAALGIPLLSYIINWPLAKLDLYLQRTLVKAKDTRMNGVNNLFQNIRFLKSYGWDHHWARNVLEKRDREIKWRVRKMLIRIPVSFIWSALPYAMGLLSFFFYTFVVGGQLTVAKAFTALSLFNNLERPMVEFPGQFFGYLDAYVSSKRIQAFLREDEVPEWASSLAKESPGETKREIGFERAVLQWTPGDPFELGPLNVKFPLGKLSLVTGPTGSGKSAFVYALLGEMFVRDGQVLISKKARATAYCAQTPWLEQCSIRSNIVFGFRDGYVEERYKQVVNACALLQDFKRLPEGDKTEIGESGVTLSGGQKARVALARALYSEAKCIILDDPLAAVDMQTARHIVKNCLQGALARDRTIILVTHHISLCLSMSNYIVELSHGKVIRQGTIDELQAQGDLKAIVQEEDVSNQPFQQAGEEEEEEEEEGEAAEGDEIDVDTAMSVDTDTEHIQKKLVQGRYREEGRVSAWTYLNYFKTSGVLLWALTIVLMAFMRLATLANCLFLAKWAEAYGSMHQHRPNMIHLFTSNDPSKHFLGLPPPEQNVKPWLLTYLFTSMSITIFLLSYFVTSFFANLRASRKYFSGMLTRLIRAPSQFYDTTPIGRILNRFSSDVQILDTAIYVAAYSACGSVLSFITTFAFIIYAVPMFGPIALIIAFLFIRLAPKYVQTARELRRLESVSLSPTFAGFDEVLKGLSHIRAFAMEERYQDAFFQKLDTTHGINHIYWLAVGWLQWRYDCLGSLVVLLSSVSSIWAGTSSALTAVVIVQAARFASACRSLVSDAASLELDLSACKRIEEYLQVEQEAKLVIEDRRPPAYWPSSDGSLEVEDLVIQYSPDLPPALDRVSFTVKPGCKVGIVGRTGSGKSTLAASLVRIVEPVSGKITLDGVDISTIGLEDLRTRITLLSQDATLLTGTVRDNLDPFGDHTDLECNDILKRCYLMKGESDPQQYDVVTLDTPIGKTRALSAGERQLIALARAMLRRSKLIIMDEATSQIDHRLDDKIQKTIREEFSDCMVIMIAHRLKTIIDYDFVMVMGKGGKVAEFDAPKTLLKKRGSAFRKLCMRSPDWKAINSELRGSSSFFGRSIRGGE